MTNMAACSVRTLGALSFAKLIGVQEEEYECREGSWIGIAEAQVHQVARGHQAQPAKKLNIKAEPTQPALQP